MLEDGTAPTESVVIERVCSGAPHAEGYTDSKGYFSIQLGLKNNGVLQDASEEMGGFGSASSAGPGGFGERRQSADRAAFETWAVRRIAISIANCARGWQVFARNP